MSLEERWAQLVTRCAQALGCSNIYTSSASIRHQLIALGNEAAAWIVGISERLEEVSAEDRRRVLDHLGRAVQDSSLSKQPGARVALNAVKFIGRAPSAPATGTGAETARAPATAPPAAAAAATAAVAAAAAVAQAPKLGGGRPGPKLVVPAGPLIAALRTYLGEKQIPQKDLERDASVSQTVISLWMRQNLQGSEERSAAVEATMRAWLSGQKDGTGTEAARAIWLEYRERQQQPRDLRPRPCPLAAHLRRLVEGVRQALEPSWKRTPHKRSESEPRL